MIDEFLFERIIAIIESSHHAPVFTRTETFIDLRGSNRFNPFPMNTSLGSLLALVFALTLAAARAEEKNGLSVNVSKTVIEKNDTRGNGYYSDRLNRTQGLKASIKNTSFKEMPEGEVVWTILVKKWGYSTPRIESYTGSEKLKALKPAETADMVIGNAEVTGYNYSGSTEKDKIEWQIVVKQDGKEMFKVASTSAFDSMAKHATKPSSTSKNNGN